MPLRSPSSLYAERVPDSLEMNEPMFEEGPLLNLRVTNKSQATPAVADRRKGHRREARKLPLSRRPLREAMAATRPLPAPRAAAAPGAPRVIAWPYTMADTTSSASDSPPRRLVEVTNEVESAARLADTVAARARRSSRGTGTKRKHQDVRQQHVQKSTSRTHGHAAERRTTHRTHKREAAASTTRSFITHNRLLARPPTSIFARAQSSVAVQNEPRAAHDARASGAVIERQAGGSGQDQHWLERWVAAATTPTPIPVRATQKMATASPDGPVMEMSTPTTPLPWAVDTADREEQRAMEAEMEHVNQQLASLAAKYGARAENTGEASIKHLQRRMRKNSEAGHQVVPPSAPRAASSTRDCTVPAAETLVQHADAAFTSPVLWKAAPAQPRARSSPPVQRRHQYEAATRQPPSLLDELDISPTEYIGDLF